MDEKALTSAQFMAQEKLSLTLTDGVDKCNALAQRGPSGQACPVLRLS